MIWYETTDPFSARISGASGVWYKPADPFSERISGHSGVIVKRGNKVIANAEADLRFNSLFGTVMAAVGAAVDRIMRSATVDAIRAALNDLTGRVVEKFGVPGQVPDLASRMAVDFMSNYGAQRVQDIGETTRQMLRDTLTEGLRAGETQDQLAGRVRTYFRGVSQGRARTIALTEAHNAVSYGMFAGMAAAGVTAKVWRSQRDDRVRETHVELDGQIRHLGDPFEIPSTGATAMRPGGFGDPAEDVNCRCIAEPAGNMPTGLSANAGDGEWPRRLAVHERRVLAAFRRGFREQQRAVLAVLAGTPPAVPEHAEE